MKTTYAFAFNRDLQEIGQIFVFKVFLLTNKAVRYWVLWIVEISFFGKILEQKRQLMFFGQLSYYLKLYQGDIFINN